MNFYIYSPPCFYSSQDGPNSGCRDCLSCVLGPPWSRVRRGIFSWLQSATTLHTPNPPRRQESSPGLIPNISDSCQQWCLQMTWAVAPWNITACMRSNYFFSWNRNAEGRKKYIGFGECLDQESCGLWDDRCPQHPSTIQHRPRDGEDESRGKSHANPSWISGGSRLMSGFRMRKWMKWDLSPSPHPRSGCCTQRADLGLSWQSTRRGEADFVFTSLMLGAQTRSKLVDSVCFLLYFSPCCLCLHSPRHNLRYAPREYSHGV